MYEKQSILFFQKAFYDESQLITAAKKRAASTAILVHSEHTTSFAGFYITYYLRILHNYKD